MAYYYSIIIYILWGFQKDIICNFWTCEMILVNFTSLNDHLNHFKFISKISNNTFLESQNCVEADFKIKSHMLCIKFCIEFKMV